MDNNTQKYKISNIYINQQTHATLKALAAHQETTMQALAADWLEETQPILKNMADALDDIKNGEEAQRTYNNYIAKGLRMAADSVQEENTKK